MRIAKCLFPFVIQSIVLAWFCQIQFRIQLLEMLAI